MGQKQAICAINEFNDGRACTNPQIGGDNRYCTTHWEQIFDSIVDTKDIDDRIRWINRRKGWNAGGKNVTKERIEELNKDINCLNAMRYTVHRWDPYTSLKRKLKLHVSRPKRITAIHEQNLRIEQYKLDKKRHDEKCQEECNKVKHDLPQYLELLDRNDDTFWDSITKSPEWSYYTREQRKTLYMKLRYGSEYGTTTYLDKPLKAKDPESFSYVMCLICKKNPTYTLPCKHRSHMECIEWLNPQNPRCPVCVQSIVVDRFGIGNI